MSGAETFDVQTADGHRFGASLHRATAAGAPLLLFMPAMGTRSRYYGGFAAAMAQAGVSLATCDWRGMESSSLRASHRVDFGYRHLVELDLPAAVTALRQRLPQAPLFVGGHSLGGQLGCLYTAANASLVRGLVLIASGTVHFSAWAGAGALRILALTQSAGLISRVVGHFPGQRIGFAGREARGVIRDWAGTARSGRYRPAGTRLDYEAAMAQLEKPTLALGFQADHLAPRKATSALLAKLPRCHRTQWHWSAADSGGQGLDHFSWAKRPELVAPPVATWVRQQAAEAT